MRNLRLVHSDTTEPAVGPSPRALTIAPLDADVRLMLQPLRIVAPLPHSVRARVLARARALVESRRKARAPRS